MQSLFSIYGFGNPGEYIAPPACRNTLPKFPGGRPIGGKKCIVPPASSLKFPGSMMGSGNTF